MTCVEFFDSNAIENIFTCLTLKPDRVILIGSNGKQLARHAERYRDFTLEKGLDTEFAYYSITKNDIADIVDRLSEIVEMYEDCVFDLTGGDELYLTAAGMILERYSDKNIQMHRVNYLSRKAYDVDGDGNSISERDMPDLTVRDCIRIYGGDVHRTGSPSDIDGDTVTDINALWDICRKDPLVWNRQTGIIAAAEAEDDGNDHLKTVFKESFVERRIGWGSVEYTDFHGLLDKLSKRKLVCTGYDDDGSFFLTYKNRIVKNCLTVSGRILELQIYVAALNYKTGKELFYNDVENSVLIDWDGEDPEGFPDTLNEIDVMMMRGVIPVFVSCKNGRVKTDELYKLNTVALRFGGKYAKKVLAAAGKVDADNDLKARAGEMGIKIIDGLCRFDGNGILKELRKFW